MSRPLSFQARCFPAAAFAAAIATLTAPSQANAQDPKAEDRAFTAGVERPIHDYSGEGDASSLELNPALLSAVEGIDFTIRGFSALSDYTRGRGFGGFLSANAFGVAVGLGVQFLKPGFSGYDFDAVNNQDMTKVSFGVAGGSGEHGSFGFAISGVQQQGVRLRQPDLDFGAMMRMTNYASLGLAARFAPVDLAPNSQRPETNLVAELALRPLGTRHFEIAGGVKARLDKEEQYLPAPAVLLPRARMAINLRGWSIGGELEQVQASVLDNSTLERLSRVRAWRGSVALGMSWDYMTAGAGVQAGLSGGVDGVGYMARFSSTGQDRVYGARSVDVERIDVSEITDERSLIRTLVAIKRAERGGERSIVLVDAREVGVGWASLEELRDALVRLRNAGGHVFAYVEQPGTAEYYLASVGEKIYMHVGGELDIFGLSSVGIYLRDALAKIGVRVEALYIKEYKSAHEQFTRASRSRADRQQRSELLSDTFGVFTHDVAQARGLSLAQVKDLVDDAPYGPEDAVAAKLVDEVVHRDELREKISEAVGAQVSFRKFGASGHEEPTWGVEPYVAVVLVEGTIVDGEGRSLPILNVRNVGGDTIADTLRAVRVDPACKGIVLRVNSPGGSAFASEVIWREVSLTHTAHLKDPKSAPPIVVSMGDVAGSGGYYVAMGTDHIFAQASTITGSIGVISMHYDVSGLLRILGINTDTLREGENAGIGALWRPFTKDQRARLQASMERFYDLFRKRVADARELDMEKVDELGRGRVYSGKDAQKLGLVDEIGGLDEALTRLRKQMGVGKRFRLPVRVLPEEPGLLDLLLKQSGPLMAAPSRRLRARREAKIEQALPQVFNEAIARIPLSTLFLPQTAPSAVMPANLRVR